MLRNELKSLRRIVWSLSVVFLALTGPVVLAFAATLGLKSGTAVEYLIPFGASVLENICVRSMGYWKNHPEAWPVDELVVGEMIYSEDDAIDILMAPPRGDASIILAHQLIPALLNVAAGADGSSIDETVTQAQAWMVAFPIGSDPKEPDRSVGISNADTLEAFNTGQLGPDSCDNADDAHPGPSQVTTLIALKADPMTVPADGESVVAVKITVHQGDSPAASSPVSILLTTTLGTFADGATEGVVELVGDAGQITLYTGTEPGPAVITAQAYGSMAKLIVEFTLPIGSAEQATAVPEGTASASLMPTSELPTSEPMATQETPAPPTPE